jgi:hypothetical protein
VNERVSGDALELSVPADPALALTARMFAGAVAEHVDGTSPDDLKLAFSELLASAVESGSDAVAFRVDLERAEVIVGGTGAESSPIDGVEEHERFARSHRADLLAALFPSMHSDGSELVLPLDHRE